MSKNNFNGKVGGYLFLKVVNDKVYYRFVQLKHACSENEIDTKCNALPHNKEHLIPVLIRNFPTGIFEHKLVYTLLHKGIIDIERQDLKFSKLKGWYIEKCRLTAFLNRFGLTGFEP